MKKFLYSKYTKFIAAVIFVVCIVSGALLATTRINFIVSNEKDMIYQFEGDFTDSQQLKVYLYEPENVIYHAYHNFYIEDGDVESVPRTEPLTVDGQTLEQNIEQRLDDMWCKDKIDYYIKWNERVFTNCGANSPEELNRDGFYSYVMRPGKGDIHLERETSFSDNRYLSHYMLNEVARFDEQDAIEIAVTINEGYLTECDDDWHRQESLINDLINEVLFFVIVALLMFIYLICVCGKNKDGEIVPMWIDNIWLEVHLAAMCIIGFGALCIIAILMDDVFTGHFPEKIFNIIQFFAVTIASSAILTSFLSIIRNIKRKNFIASSITMRVIRWCWRIFVKVLVWIRNRFVDYRSVISKTMHKKTGTLLIGSLFIYTAIIGLFGIFACEFATMWIFIGFLLFCAASYMLAHRAKDVDEIKKGVSEIRNYNTSYQIPELKCDDLKELASNINEIGNSIDESVTAKMKAERMKTELITNVSHDLKTPLTSIISYTELLSKVDGLPEEAQDYVKVIAKKSDRLKTLTQDLFDISKAQSGNEEIVFEKLDAQLLINQAMAELESEIKDSEITFCIDAGKELFFSADGRKMSRVMSNLINNILKYSMKNTRAFISAKEKDGQIILELKNTSAYPLDFDAEEIMGRFVRGDESRTTEGSGLGLAIAKSYTELCNGTLEIVLDGDLFKAIVKFRKY